MQGEQKEKEQASQELVETLILRRKTGRWGKRWQSAGKVQEAWKWRRVQS
jgi:hypothetical protein